MSQVRQKSTIFATFPFTCLGVGDWGLIHIFGGTVLRVEDVGARGIPLARARPWLCPVWSMDFGDQEFGSIRLFLVFTA